MENKQLFTDQLEIIRKIQDECIGSVPMISVAEKLGLTVYKVSSWADNISGMIKKYPEAGNISGYAIFVNAKHGPKRQRFTVAHEIAHFILHKDLIGDGILDDGLYRSGLSNKIESQANSLAADILMPYHLIDKARRGGFSTTKALAERLNVSEQAMSIRIGGGNIYD
jgi:Zn-dependent peptidase ImmA (M78 family)